MNQPEEDLCPILDVLIHKLFEGRSLIHFLYEKVQFRSNFSDDDVLIVSLPLHDRFFFSHHFHFLLGRVILPHAELLRFGSLFSHSQGSVVRRTFGREMDTRQAFFDQPDGVVVIIYPQPSDEIAAFVHALNFNFDLALKTVLLGEQESFVTERFTLLDTGLTTQIGTSTPRAADTR